MSNISLEQLNKMSKDDLAKLVQELAVKNQRKVSMKVSEKGALSVYGIHTRFPVTLYASQWETLLQHSKAISDFIAAAGDKLARKSIA